MEPFRYHVFVCLQEKPEGVTSCTSCGSGRALDSLHRELAAQGFDSDVQVTSCGCLGLCDDGPIMIVYPEGTWYRKVNEEDVSAIVSSHFRGGKAVSRLVWHDAAAMKAASTEHRERYLAMLRAKDAAGTLPDDLNEMAREFMSSRTLLTALELDIFSAVGSGAKAEGVCKRIKADLRATEMLLNALVSLKLLEKREETFFNTSASARFFVHGSCDNARPGLLHIAHLYHRWSTLTDCVRAGTSVGSAERGDDQLQDFIAAMNYNAKERTGAVLKAVEKNGIRRMLDLGGGSGAYSIAFVKALPKLEAEILDLAEVVPLTQKYVSEAGVGDRIKIRTGDMLRDKLGENYDLILIMAISHMFSPEENRALLRRAHDALAPGGRIVIQDFILEPNKTAPRFATLFSLNMLVGTGAGSSYSECELGAWLKEAGFDEIQRVRLPGPAGLMIGVRP